jgi:hypothetical protein
MDDPELVFNGALENHVNMIKQFKGMVIHLICCFHVLRQIWNNFI